MRAWVVAAPGPIDTRPLRLVELPDPQPGPGEVRVRVTTCGVCRTDLHLAEGDLPPPAPGVVPGHEIVGIVDALGERASRFAVGDRIEERVLTSVTAATRSDGEEFLAMAARVPVRVASVPYDFGAVDSAVADLAHGRFTGAAVVHVGR